LLDQDVADGAIKPVDIAVKPNVLTVLTGPSGVGKSTSLKALRDQNSAWMPQRTVLFDGTVRSNIVGASRVDGLVLARAVEMAALNDLDLDSSVGGNFSTVSGGQQQRIALARVFYRALLLDSRVILLDEPTSALDEARATSVLNSLRLLATEGRAVVAVSHHSGLIAAADQVIEVKA
jgi:ABC-type transport system involved in cytochrome bd biosynthesis fused ATPase/permease subunit